MTISERLITNEMIAYDLLMTAKAGVKCYAAAITETPTYELRTMLQRQLDDAIGAHEQIMNYMMNKDWYDPYEVQNQLKLDFKNAKAALRDS